MRTTSGLGVGSSGLPRAAALYASKASRPFVAVSRAWPCFLAYAVMRRKFTAYDGKDVRLSHDVFVEEIDLRCRQQVAALALKDQSLLLASTF
jgi:hypothetical protein